MFVCRSCMRQQIRILTEDSILYHAGQRSATLRRQAIATTARRSSTMTVVQQQGNPEAVRIVRSSRQDENYRPGRTMRNVAQNSNGARVRSSWEYEKELEYLRDPLKLADRVLNLLQKGKIEDSIILVRTSSKTINCTVSWNHVIDWQMSKGKVNAAFKTFNEMKKRRQAPDARTYTILFRGLAVAPQHPHIVSKALSTYHAMDAENSPVKPNTIHTNAVLKVCARALDMDALFGIFAKLQRKGLKAPNNLTFTTVLNAIRQNAILEPSGHVDEEERSMIRQKAIMQARGLWDDIIDRWRQGDLWVDEELVCSMGRILLLGNRNDWNDVFSLVEQTMNITNPTTLEETVSGGNTHSAARDVSKSVVTVQEESSQDCGTTDLVPRNEFQSIKPPAPRTRGASPYAIPGPNSLSLVLEAIYQLRVKSSLSWYWKVFVDTYKSVPDSQNFHSYLRILRGHRASSETIDVLQQMPNDMLQKKTFRIAMSTCERDKNNAASFANAGKVLDLMQQSLADLDLPALHSYMVVAIYGASPRGSTNQDIGRRILRTLHRLNPAVLNLKSSINYGDSNDSHKSATWDAKNTEAAGIALIREMIGAYDRLMNKGMVDREIFSTLGAEKSKLAAFVTRYMAKQSKSTAKVTNTPQDKTSSLEIQQNQME